MSTTRADMYMEIDSIVIKIDVLAVSAGSGPREMLSGSLGTSIIFFVDMCFSANFEFSSRRIGRTVRVCLTLGDDLHKSAGG